MKKDIVIIGPSRSGKSHLGRKLGKALGSNYIMFDNIVDVLDAYFPEAKIGHLPNDNSNFYKFFTEYIKKINSRQDSHIVDVEAFSPDEVISGINLATTEVIYLGYPDISVEEKLKQIREHDDPVYDWTSYTKISDEELREFLKDKIELSKKWKDDCARTGLRFIDLSHGDRDEIFNFVVKEFTDKQKTATQDYAEVR